MSFQSKTSYRFGRQESRLRSQSVEQVINYDLAALHPMSGLRLVGVRVHKQRNVSDFLHSKTIQRFGLYFDLNFYINWK